MQREPAIQDEWTVAATAFRQRALSRATVALRNALDDSPPDRTLLRSVLQVNKYAVRADSARDSAPPPHVPIPSKSPLALRLLAFETVLTSAYNTTLRRIDRLAPDDDLNAIADLDLALERIPAVLAHAYGHSRRKPSLAQSDWNEVLTIANAARLNENIFQNLPREACASMQRFCEAGAEAFELRSAVALSRREVQAALSASEAAQALRKLGSAELARPPDSHGNSELQRSQGTVKESERRHANLREKDIHHSFIAEKEGARAEWLKAIAECMRGDWDSALQAVIERGREDASNAAECAIDQHHLPTAYLTGALLLRRGGNEEDRKLATRVLEICAVRGYRTADSLALMARLCSHDPGGFTWQRVLALDFRRPSALWLAARDFARSGKVIQQTEILRCLQEVLKLTTKASVKPGSMGERLRLQAMSEGAGSPSGQEINGRRVRLALASALCDAEKWSEAERLLQSREDDADDIELKKEEGTVPMWHGLQSWATLHMGKVERGLQLAESTADVAGNNNPWVVCSHLGRAEAFMRLERVEEACTAVLEAFRVANNLAGYGKVECMLLRGLCFHNLGVTKYCLRNEHTADECFAAAQAALEKCSSEAPVKGIRDIARKFATCASFSRCIAMWAQGRPADAASHWIAKWDSGGDSPTEEHFVDDAKDESKGKMDRYRLHVAPMVSKQTVQTMSTVCRKICRDEDSKQRLQTMVQNIQREWPSR